MSRTADALLKISEALAEIAYDLGQDEQPRAGTVAGVSSPPARATRPVASPPSFDELPPEYVDAGSRPNAIVPHRLPARKPAEFAFTKCPAHGVEFKESTFPESPPYCPMESEDPDPNWTNAKGRCRVTARNAGAWLKQHPRGAAA